MCVYLCVYTGADWPLGHSGGARAGANILLKWAGYPCSDFFIHLFNLKGPSPNYRLCKWPLPSEPVGARFALPRETVTDGFPQPGSLCVA